MNYLTIQAEKYKDKYICQVLQQKMVGKNNRKSIMIYRDSSIEIISHCSLYYHTDCGIIIFYCRGYSKCRDNDIIEINTDIYEKLNLAINKTNKGIK